jgi:hypothetical protein
VRGRTIQVSGKVGSFPVPAGANVAENIASGQETIIIFDKITPAKVSSFYARALPQAGYTVTTFIQFTGHGFKGTSTRCPSSPIPP